MGRRPHHLGTLLAPGRSKLLTRESFRASSLPARAEVVTTRLAQTATALREDFGAGIRIDVVRMAQEKLTNISGLAAAGFQR